MTFSLKGVSDMLRYQRLTTFLIITCYSVFPRPCSIAGACGRTSDIIVDVVKGVTETAILTFHGSTKTRPSASRTARDITTRDFFFNCDYIK